MNNMGKMISISELSKYKTNYKRANNNIKNLNPIINVIAETSNDSQIYPLLSSREDMIKAFQMIMK